MGEFVEDNKPAIGDAFLADRDFRMLVRTGTITPDHLSEVTDPPREDTVERILRDRYHRYQATADD